MSTIDEVSVGGEERSRGGGGVGGVGAWERCLME